MGASSNKSKNISNQEESQKKIYDQATDSSNYSINYSSRIENEKDLSKKKFPNIDEIKEQPEELNQINEDLKKILFLYIQQKELKNIMDINNNLSEEDEFYLVNDSLGKKNANYNIEKIFQYLKDYKKIKNLSIRNIDKDFKILLMEKYSGYEIDRNLININEDQELYYEIELNYYENIPFPINFFLIQSKYFEDFIKVYNEKQNESNYSNNKYKGYFIKNFILLENNEDSEWKYIACSMKENEFINFSVDFIFMNSENKEINFKNIKDFLENKKSDLSLANQKIKLNDKENDGYVICFPSNELNSEENYEPEIYNRIKNYFFLNSKYKDFVSSINEIENNFLDSNDMNEIEKLKFSQRKRMNEFLVYIFNEKTFKKIKNKIYLDDYDKHKNGNNKLKEKIINKIYQKEKHLEEKSNKYPILSFEDLFIIKENKEKICLINEEISKGLKNMINLDNLDDINNRNLLKINDEYYLYFNKDNKLAKIIKEKENIWSIDITDEEYNDYKEESLKIKKNLLLYFYIRNKNNIRINKDKFCSDLNYSLINKDWLDKYKNNYKFDEIIKPSTNILEYKSYEELESNLENIIKNNNDVNKIYLKINCPSEFNTMEIFPKKENEYPINFEIIKTDLFDKLIKGTDKKYDIKENKTYNILFGDKAIILYELNGKQLILYSLEIIDQKKNFKIKYKFEFDDPSILENQINKIIDNKIINYINNLFLDISQEENQDIIEKDNNGNSQKIGTFYNLKPEKLCISLFSKPPLIGLQNIGATCYMNATLQCFSNIDKFTDFFLLNQKEFINSGDTKYDLVKEYAVLIKNLWKLVKKTKSDETYAPNDFKKRIGEKNPLFSGIMANDSKDLIMFVLEALHKELNQPNLEYIKKLEADLNNQNNFQIQQQSNEIEEHRKFAEDYYNKNKSIIQELFYGEQESFTFCHECKANIYNFSIFSFLIFPLEKVRQYLVNSNKQFENVTLEDCFEHYIAEELMTGQNQMYCNKCKKNTDFSMVNKLYKHPEILILILNRGKGLEYVVPFKYPKSIILNKYFNFENNTNYKDNNTKIEYEFISVITHLGESSDSGHFIAYCKSPVDKEWYLYNDSIVSKSDDPSNFSSKSNDNIPYVLFYQFKNQNQNKNQIKKSLNNSINIKSSVNKKSDITLYFKFPNEKELYIDVNENMKFEEVVNLFFKANDIKMENYEYFKIFDFNKTVKENGLKNEDHINIKPKQ